MLLTTSPHGYDWQLTYRFNKMPCPRRDAAVGFQLHVLVIGGQ